jgi:hypothetical protein
LTVTLWLLVNQHASAQDIVRLELDATDLSLPYYTIPAGKDGVIILRATEARGRRIIAWEMLHYDVALRPVNQKPVALDAGKEYFAGWKINETHLVLLFLHDLPVSNGYFLCYSLTDKQLNKHSFDLKGRFVMDPVFYLTQNCAYLSGIHRTRTGWWRRIGSLMKGKDPLSEFVTIRSGLDNEDVTVLVDEVQGLRSVMQTQSLPPDKKDETVIAMEIETGRYQREIRVVSMNDTATAVKLLGQLSSTPERFIDEITFLSTDSIPLAMAGSYGSRSKREWKNEEQVPASGIFFSAISTDSQGSFTSYPFNVFSHLLTVSARKMAQTGQSGAMLNVHGQARFRLLLHKKTYQQNGNTLLVGETFFPEYEYDQRVQQFYMPYSYYGYYPGIYDRGGRWIFKGFRYEHALVAAFDPTGNLVWENSFETSDILDQQLESRIILMPYDDEVVMVYAHNGRVIYRVIRERDVLVDKESFPVELPATGDRIRENHAMNMAPWYDNFFIVWGRHHIRNTDGQSRTVFYCNKIAFE